MANIDQLIEVLHNKDPDIRYEACKKIADEKNLPDAAYDAIQELSEDPEPQVRGAARQVLFKRNGVSLSAENTEKDQDAEAYIEESVKQEGSRPKHPWFKIWIKPRGTIREIINYDPKYLVIPIVLIAGIGSALDRVMSRNFGDRYELITILLMIFIVGPIGGLISLYIGSAILSWLGKKLGGHGSSEEVRTAMAWSLIPWVLVLVVNLVQLAIFGVEEFSIHTPKFDSMIGQSLTSWAIIGIYVLCLTFFGVVIYLWTLFLNVKCLAEAHQFSSWRSLATLAIPTICVLIIGLGCIFTVLR